MIGVEEALELLRQESGRLGVENCSLGQARGRYLAESIQADRDFPPSDRSAMDGYALRAADASEPGQELEVVGEARAGAPVSNLRVGPGQATRIFTGAMLPPGADSVVMVERTESVAGERVRVDVAVRRGDHVRRKGEDLAAGDVVLSPGMPIGPAEIAALASVGRTELTVHCRPRVHIVSTGDEIVEPETDPREHQVRNSNAPMLLAQLAELGLDADYLGIAPDQSEGLHDFLHRGLAGEVLLVTGGVSVGKYDLVGEVLANAGMRTVFHKVAVKPGKPLLAGRLKSCLVFGLPGNPVSSCVGFALFVAPVLRRLQGARHWRNVRLPARLEAPLRLRPGRETLTLARMRVEGRELLAKPVASTGSGDVLSMVRANGFVVSSPDAADLPAGTEVEALLWQDFHAR